MTLSSARGAVLVLAGAALSLPLSLTAATAQDMPAGLTAATAQNIPADFTDIVAEMAPSVVAISTQRVMEGSEGMADRIPPELRERFEERFGQPFPEDGQEPRQAQAQGSGFLISEDGHIVTNNHVIAAATDIQVVLDNGATRPAELVGTDPATDLAVLQIDSLDGAVVAEWGDSEAMQPGAWTIAIGSPFGLGGTVTVGVLSALSRDIRTGPYDDYLQTDASINRGNSGGPLFNDAGEVIGVNTAIFSPTGTNVGIGFAVPSQTARLVIDELIETGEVRRGFIGVRLQELTESLARAFELEDEQGAVIAQVEPGGPGDAAGLETGDVVLELDGQTITDPRTLSFAVAEREPGDEVNLTVQRGGQRMDIAMTLGSREFPETTAAIEPEPAAPATSEEGRLGLSLSPLPSQLREELDIAEGGVVVQEVVPDSAAAEAGLMLNDVILEAAGAPVMEPNHLAAAWEQARDEERPMLMRIQRGDALLYVAVEG